jgi:hypothetical protein
MNISLYDEVRKLIIKDCRKHDLDNDCEAYATRKINMMTNDELLKEISDTLELIIKLS